MSKFILVLWVSCCILITPATSTIPTQQTVSSDTQAPRQSIIRPPRILTLILLAIATELFVMAASEPTQQKVLGQLEPSSLLKNFAVEYATHANATLLHELGHTIAARLLTGQLMVVHLGSYEKKPLLDLGPIKIDGLDPNAGLTANQIDLEQSSSNQKGSLSTAKKALFLLAGGSTAITCHYLIKLLLASISNLTTKDQRPLNRIFTLDPILIEQLITMLWPLHVKENSLSDGGKLWQDCVGLDPQIVSTASAIAPAIEYAGEVALAYTTAKGQQPSAIDLLIIALLNQNLRGYLRFTA